MTRFLDSAAPTPPTPPPPGTPEPPSEGPFPQGWINDIETLLASGNTFRYIDAMERIARGRPPGVSRQDFERLATEGRRKLSRALGVQMSDVGIMAVPLLTLYRNVFEGATTMSNFLNQGPEAVEENRGSFINWFNSLQQFKFLLNSAPSNQRLSNRFKSLMEEGGASSDFDRIIQDFSALGITPDGPPTLPDDPSTLPGEGSGDGFGPGINIDLGGGFRASESRTREELRVPTDEEFLNDFDNAFLRMLGVNREDLTQGQFNALQEKRNELLSRYISRLGAFAEKGESPFLHSTRTGDVTSESKTREGVAGDEDSPVITETTRFGVETPSDVNVGFLTARVTPTDFLAELFPTTSSLKNFAEGPDEQESRLPSSGFAGGTSFRDAAPGGG